MEEEAGFDPPDEILAFGLFELLFMLLCLLRAKPLTCSSVEIPPNMLENPLLLVAFKPLPFTAAVLLTLVV